MLKWSNFLLSSIIIDVCFNSISNLNITVYNHAKHCYDVNFIKCSVTRMPYEWLSIKRQTREEKCLKEKKKLKEIKT